jgi:hypothetical protein
VLTDGFKIGDTCETNKEYKRLAEDHNRHFKRDPIPDYHRGQIEDICLWPSGDTSIQLSGLWLPVDTRFLSKIRLPGKQ